MVTRSAAVATGLLVDGLVGDPPSCVHPVAWFGRAMDRLERTWWGDRRSRGTAHAAVGLTAGVLGGLALEGTLGRGGGLVLATATAAGARTLLETAAEVGHLLAAGDLGAARRLLPALVGRDPDGLDPGQVARAVVESVAENLSDAVVATALWGVVAGAPGAAAHRAVNTLDAMVGYRTPRYARFGWASARLDDLMGWPAARATALLVAAAAPARAAAVWAAVRAGASSHPSPNAGVAEAAFAGALGIRLGGTSHYGGVHEERPILGSGRDAEPGDIDRAVSLARRVVLLLVVVLLGQAVVGVLRGQVLVGHPRAR